MNLSTVLDPRHTALLVVDMQNGFCHPEGTIGRALGADAVAKPRDIVPGVVTLMRTCRSTGVAIWLTRQEHWPGDQRRSGRLIPSHLDRHGVTGLCEQATWDSDLVDAIAAEVQTADTVIVKHRSSAFYATPLEQQLRMRGIRVLVVAGTTTSFCVDSTIRDAYARDFDVVVPADAVADSDDDLQAATLRCVDRFHGHVSSCELVTAALEHHRAR